MDFWDWVLVAVIAGVILAAILGIVRWSWTRRRRPLDWMATGKAAAEHRRRRIEAARHGLLVEWVFQRAEVLGLQVAASATTEHGFVTVTLHPSDERLRYAAEGTDPGDLIRMGFYDRRTFNRTWTMKPVPDWTDEELRAFLAKYADQIPPETSQS